MSPALQSSATPPIPHGDTTGSVSPSMVPTTSRSTHGENDGSTDTVCPATSDGANFDSSSSGTSPPTLEGDTLSLLSSVLTSRARNSATLRSLHSSRPGSGASTPRSRRQSSNRAYSSSSSSSSSAGRSGGKVYQTSTAATSIDSQIDLHYASTDGGKRRNRKEGTYEVVEEADALADLERLNGISFEDPYHTGCRDVSVAAVLPSPSGSSLYGAEDQEDDGGGGEEEGPMSLDDFFTIFGEDWQLSQFWYTEEFTKRLVNLIDDILASSSEGLPAGEGRRGLKTIAFLCSPTAYVGYHALSPFAAAKDTQTLLLEYDTRFRLVVPSPPSSSSSSSTFIKYDLNTPLSPPSFLEEWRGKVDLCVVDPPFLNLDTNQKLAQTVRHLTKSSDDKEGKVLLITGDSIVEQVKELYLPHRPEEEEPQQDRMKRLDVEVQHRGLANEFGAWCNV